MLTRRRDRDDFSLDVVAVNPFLVWALAATTMRVKADDQPAGGPEPVADGGANILGDNESSALLCGSRT
jgi:hypothetical protein